MKKPLVFAFAALSALALAAGQILHSNGTGAAATADGRLGAFDYRALKRTDANGIAVKYEGRLRFEQRPNERGRYVLIEMGVPDALGQNAEGNVCEFGGRGTLVTLVEGRRTSFRGRVSVRAADRRAANQTTGERDRFRVRFVGERGPTFEFDGLVGDGDLVVGKRPAP